MTKVTLATVASLLLWTCLPEPAAAEASISNGGLREACGKAMLSSDGLKRLLSNLAGVAEELRSPYLASPTAPSVQDVTHILSQYTSMQDTGQLIRFLACNDFQNWAGGEWMSEAWQGNVPSGAALTFYRVVTTYPIATLWVAIDRFTSDELEVSAFVSIRPPVP